MLKIRVLEIMLMKVHTDDKEISSKQLQKETADNPAEKDWSLNNDKTYLSNEEVCMHDKYTLID